MFPFPQSVTPAVRSHLDAQVAFLNDVSKSFTRSFQNLVDLNLQLGQTLLEESSITYQQHLSRVVADAQVELARVTEQHVQETSRTARGLADQVARTASEETQESIRKQEETLKNFRDPFQGGNGNAGLHASGNLQSAGGSASASVDVDSRGASVRQEPLRLIRRPRRPVSRSACLEV
jgi:hypothetical protein